MLLSLTRLKFPSLIGRNRKKAVGLKARSQLGGDGKDEEELSGLQT
jgi:hypothetical protein